MAEPKLIEKIKTILIVDDTPENVSLMEAILSTEYTVKSASRGSEALEIARAEQPDLILLDIMMPEMNGYDVCKLLKSDAVTGKIPVIFVTALLSPGDETRGFEAGGVDYIIKPVVGSVVRSRIKSHLALNESHNDLEEWNYNLRKRLLQSVRTIRTEAVALMALEEKSSALNGYVQSIELISGVFHLREDSFGVRSMAISELAGDAARKMNLSAENVAKIRLAGLMHDVGTLGPTHAGAEKPESEMTSKEREEFRSHPARGQELFHSLEELTDVGLMVRGHHEAYDGSGFPDGLSGEEIPLGARLLAIASVIEHAASSVSSDRDEYALMQLRHHSGTLLDPKLVTCFTMITRILYFKRKKPGAIGEVEVPPNDLITGMQLSRDLSNKAGVLLLQKGDKLDVAGIALIRRNSQMNRPADGGVWMYINNVE
jgi:putative two-component system response regulator